MFSDRIQKIKPSPTLAAAARARELTARGIDLIDFTVGELIFPTPEKIKTACKKALDDNLTRYAPVPGLPKLREAVALKYGYAPEEIIITCGAKQAIFTAIQVLINPGDEVLIPAPYWVSYPDQVMLAGGRPVILLTTEKTGFKVTPEQIQKAITPKTKMLILNSPSNPTGACYAEEDWKAIGKILEKPGVWILSDEIYGKLTYDGFRHVSFARACPALRGRTILANGASKAYSMTGWRMGFAAAPKAVIEKMTVLQSQELTSIPTFIQQACITAFNDCDADVERMRRETEKKRNLMLEEIAKIPGVQCFKPQGAFYLFPNMSAFGLPTTQLADHLLEKGHVATVAGEGFGTPGYLRLSYVGSDGRICEGMRRIKDALASLRA